MDRFTNMKCACCMWFVIKVSDSSGPKTDNIVGRCRRHAPTLQGFPAVYDTDWCGDHKIDENK